MEISKDLQYFKIVANGVALPSSWMRRFDILQGFNASMVEFIGVPSLATSSHLRNGSFIIIAIQTHAK
jgi:hypothetical protein